jgi:epoxyqueuosine reductase QueG
MIPEAHPAWLHTWMNDHGVDVWGGADLQEFPTPRDEAGQGFPYALSFAIPMSPKVMADIKNGPNQAYADEYARVNRLISDLSTEFAAAIRSRGFRSQPLAVSSRTDTVSIKGEFPHKTAATRAGLGWIGRHCQLITRSFGSWVRLGTVFTDMALSCGPPVERSFCGRCTLCVEACPAGALRGRAWKPGLDREEMLDVRACDAWKKEHYFAYHQGHNCGICSAVCPYGAKSLGKASR